jgi:uroporphyrinogen decarboxylase
MSLQTRVHTFIQNASARLAMPIATYPGMALTGATVGEVVTDGQVQVAIQAALRSRYGSPFVLSAMDLSAEAEAFGCEVSFGEGEVPTVTGRLVTNLEQAEKLQVPKAGDARTGVYLSAIRGLSQLPDDPMVLGGCIGPFSLAARLAGVSEALELTASEPDLMHVLVDKSATFLTEYARAFKAAGASGLIMAEPAAGLLSPRSLLAFSSAYIRRIATAVCDETFDVILHNCAAKLLHLPSILETGLRMFHFGAPMDMAAALEKVPASTVLFGNLDPAGVFVRLTGGEVRAAATKLLETTVSHRNFVLSSGCDLPPNAPLGSLDGFYEALGVRVEAVGT